MPAHRAGRWSGGRFWIAVPGGVLLVMNVFGRFETRGRQPRGRAANAPPPIGRSAEGGGEGRPK